MMRWVVLVVLFLSGLLSTLQPQALAYCKDFEPQTVDKPAFSVTYVRVPAKSKYSVIPVVSNQLELLPNMVETLKDSAVAGINAGFFDPSNQQTTSYVVAEGKVLANPVDNRNFVENPNLYPYIVTMLNRSEFRVLECNGQRQYDIAKHRDPLKFRCKLVHSMQAGPDLYNEKGSEDEAFIAYKGSQRIRDPLGVDRRNARSAIGIDAQGNVILAMAAMKPLENLPSGATLRDMANVMRELGAVKALSLDGGSSSSFWVGGETYYGKLDKAFNPIKRPIKSALVVIRKEQR